MSTSLPMIDRILNHGMQNSRLDPEIVVDGDVRPSPINMNVEEAQSEPLRGFAPIISGQQEIKPTETGIPTTSSVTSGANGEPEPEAKKSSRKSVTFVDLVKNEQSSIIWSALTDGTPRRAEKDKSTSPHTPKLRPVEIPCPYSSCGCQETVPQGTLLEQDHYQNCNFRPIPCLLEDVCGEVIPYHDFVLHMITHFVKPEYTLSLNSRVYLWAEDFQHDQKWNPKWLCAQGNHFFVMMQRKIPGIWISWVWMLGTKEEASAYKYTLVYFKGLRSVGGAFTVHSIREHPEQIEMNKSCLLLTDQAMMSLSQIGENVLTDFSISVQITLNTVEAYEAAIAEPEPTVKALALPSAPEPNRISTNTSTYSTAESSSTMPPEMSPNLNPLENSMEALISALATEISTLVPPNFSLNSTEATIPIPFQTMRGDMEGVELAATTSLEFSPSQDPGFVQFIDSENIPLAPPGDNSSNFGYPGRSNAGGVEDDGLTLEDVLKIFTSTRGLPAYESSVSTAVGTEKKSDLDDEFLYEDALD